MTLVYLYRNGDIKIEKKGEGNFVYQHFFGSDNNGMYDAYSCQEGEEDYYVRRLIRERMREILKEVNELMDEYDKFYYLKEKVYNGEVE